MTLISSALNGGYFVGISDLMLSYDDGLERRKVALPLHREMKATAGNVAVAGVAQKSVLIGPHTLVMWAGALVVAEAIVREIRLASAGGAVKIDLLKLIDGLGLTDAESESVSIIYHFSEDGKISRSWHLASEIPTHGLQLVCAGSGQWDFFDDTHVVLIDEHDAYASVLNMWLSRLFSTLMSELETGVPLEFAYGGGGWNWSRSMVRASSKKHLMA